MCGCLPWGEVRPMHVDPLTHLGDIGALSHSHWKAALASPWPSDPCRRALRASLLTTGGHRRPCSVAAPLTRICLFPLSPSPPTAASLTYRSPAGPSSPTCHLLWGVFLDASQSHVKIRGLVPIPWCLLSFLLPVPSPACTWAEVCAQGLSVGWAGRREPLRQGQEN